MSSIYWQGNKAKIIAPGGLEFRNGGQINESTNAPLQALISDDTATGSTLYNAYLPRAWVNFNGTGTVAIRESGNVSSITDNGTGDYTVNFSVLSE